MILEAFNPAAGWQANFVDHRYNLAAKHVMKRRALFRPMVLMKEYEPAEYEVTLEKPYGLLWEEINKGAADGVKVSKLVPSGTAYKLGYPWVGDRLLECNGVDCRRMVMKDAVKLLLLSGNKINLKMLRDGSMTCVTFPDGSRSWMSPGTTLEQVQMQTPYRGVNYECMSGTCAVCEMALRQGETGGIKTVRMCVSKLPRSPPDAPGFYILPPDDPEVQAYYNKMKKGRR